MTSTKQNSPKKSGFAKTPERNSINFNRVGLTQSPEKQTLTLD